MQIMQLSSHRNSSNNKQAQRERTSCDNAACSVSACNMALDVVFAEVRAPLLMRTVSI